MARPIRAPAGIPRMPPIAALPAAEQRPPEKISMSSNPVHVFPLANPMATPARRPKPAPRMAHRPLEWRPPLRSMRVTSCRGTTTLGCPSAASVNVLSRNDWSTPTRGLPPSVGANTRRRVPGAMASASSPGELVAPIRSNPAATSRNVIMVGQGAAIVPFPERASAQREVIEEHGRSHRKLRGRLTVGPSMAQQLRGPAQSLGALGGAGRWTVPSSSRRGCRLVNDFH